VQITYAVAGFIFFDCLLLVGVFFAIRRMLRKDIRRTDEEALTPSDYSIYIRGLPPDAQIEDIRDHFSDRWRWDSSSSSSSNDVICWRTRINNQHPPPPPPPPLLLSLSTGMIYKNPASNSLK